MVVLTKMGWIRLFFETAATFLLTLCFPFSTGLRFRLTFAYILLNICVDRYRGKSLLVWDEIRRILMFYASYYLTTLLLIPFREFTFAYFLQATLFCLIDFALVMLLTRFLHHIFWNQVKKNVLVIGAGKTAKGIHDLMRLNHFSLMDIQGFISINKDPFLTKNEQNEVKQRKPVWKLKDLEKKIKELNIDTVIIAVPELSRTDLNRLNSRLSPLVDTVKYLPMVDSLITFDSQIDDFDGMLMISTTKGKMNIGDRFVKRIIDICAGLAGTAVLGPLYFYVARTNHKAGDYGPVLFSQNRIGRDGKEFKMYKFRTMVEGADQILEEMMAADPAIRAEYEENKKLDDDPRITKAGKFLREKSLDEFPQFIHVLSGKMSLIGPRPYLPREKKDMNGYYEDIIQLKPGVTGMWQTHGRSNTTFEERLELDSYYYRNWNLWLDTVLLIKTIRPWLTGKDKGAK